MNTIIQNLYLFYNCKQDSVKDVLLKPVPADYAEISASQNLMDNFGFPDDVNINLDSVKSKIPEDFVFISSPEKVAMIPSGSIRFTKDPITIS